MLKKFFIAAAAILIIFIAVVSAQPAKYHVERSAQIDASPEIVWAEVSNFAQWKAWSHWEKSDPTQKTTTTGTPGTVGHQTVWVGEKTGEGTMRITKATRPSHMEIALEFKVPMESSAMTAMQITPKGNGAEITWSMDGENDFMGKLFGLLMGVEDMIGAAYEDSLANMKTIAETNAKKHAEIEAAKTAAAQAAVAPQGESDAAEAAAPAAAHP